jgi:Tol biopolymer transport system component
VQGQASKRRRLVALVLATAGIVLAGALFWRPAPGELAHDGAPAWAPDSQRLVFSAEIEDGSTPPRRQADLFTMRADGADRRQLTRTAASDGAPAFSPDGGAIAFETDRDGQFEIYVMASGGGGERNVSKHASSDRSPAWSPDGRRIAFLSNRDRPPEFDLYTMKADGTDVRRVTAEGKNWAPQYSPFSQRIAVQTNRDIKLIDLTNGTRLRVTFDPQNGMSPTWSPDASRLAFASTRNGRLELFTMNADGTNQQVLVSMSGGSAIEPRWSPDGTRIAFVYVPDRKVESSEDDQPYAIYAIELASQRITRLSP